MGIKDWGWGQGGRRKGFPKPVLAKSCALLNFTLCVIFYFGSSQSSIRCSGMTQGSVPGAELTAPGGPNLHTTRTVCSLPGSTAPAAWCPHIPELPPPPLWLSIMDSALLPRAAIYQASLQTLLRLWQVQHSVPGRVYNSCRQNTFSQIHVLIVDAYLPPVRSVPMSIYSSPTHSEKYFVVTGLCILAKLVADYTPTSASIIGLLEEKTSWLALWVRGVILW